MEYLALAAVALFAGAMLAYSRERRASRRVSRTDPPVVDFTPRAPRGRINRDSLN